MGGWCFCCVTACLSWPCWLPHPRALQGRWHDDNSLLMLPHLTLSGAASLAASGLGSLPQLLHAFYTQRQQAVAALEAAVGQVGGWAAGWVG